MRINEFGKFTKKQEVSETNEPAAKTATADTIKTLLDQALHTYSPDRIRAALNEAMTGASQATRALLDLALKKADLAEAKWAEANKSNELYSRFVAGRRTDDPLVQEKYAHNNTLTQLGNHAMDDCHKMIKQALESLT